MSSRPPSKKPSGSRPNVRKLLSKDSISSLASFSKHARVSSLPDEAGETQASNRKKKAHALTLPPLREDENSRQVQSPWMNEEVVSSPSTAKEDHNPFDEHGAEMNPRSTLSKATLPSEHTSTASLSGRGQESPGPDSSRSSASSPVPLSPSKVRWEQLRQHVLPSLSPVPSPEPSFTSFSQRPSRFAARFGFRQVVNEAREAADDITRRFADDLQKACWTVRFVDSRPQRPEREATQSGTLGSTLHLPFMSSTSLPLSNNTNLSNQAAQSTFRGLRSASSTANLLPQNRFRTAALGSLQSIITRYSTLIPREKTSLPHEKEVLSILLAAFLTHDSVQDVNDERQVSLEIFEVIVRRWKTPDTEANIERCLWCCKAAMVPSSNPRTRVLHLLNSILNTEDSPLSSPEGLQTVLPNVALLVPHCQNFNPSQAFALAEKSTDLHVVYNIIEGIITGERGHLDMDELEQHYESLALKFDNEDDLRQGLCIEALAKNLEFGPLRERRAMLQVIEKYWPMPELSLTSTPLRSKIHLSKLKTFLRPILTMLRQSLDISADWRLTSLDYKTIIHLLTVRALPEVDILTSSEDLLDDVRTLAVKAMLMLLGSEIDEEDTFMDNGHPVVREVIVNWLNGKPTVWGKLLQRELKGLPTSDEWKIVTVLATRLLAVLPENTRKLIADLMIPQFQERIVDDPPEPSFEPLSRLLSSFAAIHPQAFYKPVFACAASVKEEIVARQLNTLIGLAQYLPHFWTTDAEMVSVALMSDPNGPGIGKGKAKEGQPLVWGRARLGQTIVLLEVISILRDIREKHSSGQEGVVTSTFSMTKVLKFAIALETRLAVLIDAKEECVLLPLSQRILFATLFLEVRLLTKSLKQIAWLPRIIGWTMQYNDDTESNTPMFPSVTEDLHDEIDEMWTRLDVVYSLAKTGMRPASSRRNTAVMSPKTDTSSLGGSLDWRENSVEARHKLLDHLPKNPLSSMLSTLVALSGALKREDYVRLGPFVWDKCLTISDTKTVLNACFICMQSAEKAQDRFVGLINARLQSPDVDVRRCTVQKLGILSNWRFQLLSVVYITDRHYRRPFKLARPALSFVATDVGDSKYIPGDDLEEAASGKGHALPLDIRRRLNEIGWDDEEKPIDQLLEWRWTPMSLLSSTQLDQLSAPNSANDDNRLSDQSPSPSPTGSGNSPSLSSRGESGLLRRNSSSHGRHSGKRRPVLVQSLVTVFLPLAKLALDNEFSVASVARDLLMDYMRDDPSVLCRPVMDILSGNVEHINNAITTLRTFLHVSKVLPPRLTHHVFNHLAGFLKVLAKDPSAQGTLRILAQAVPVLAKFAPQVSDMSVRAIRRGKVEVFLFPSSSLYFTDAAPLSPMFPKSPPPITNPFESCPKPLVDVTMIRMSQNLLFVELLKRSPQDVHVVRKNWTPLVLPEVPGLDDSIDIIPRRSNKKLIPEHIKAAFRLSLSFSRTHLLFVAQVFRCLTRHLNSREELAMFLDGVNRILLRHGDDIGIVSHSLIVYMIASTRFRRLISSAAGFTIFLPVLIKIYCEAEGDAGVREAIEYAVHRFFAVHEEVFVYQILQIASGIVALPSADGHWISNRVYRLLSSLKSAPVTIDAAGIRDANRSQEEETALAITADERPQIFLASLRKENKGGDEKIKSSLSVEIFDKKRFHPDNIIRMLLTVIAHDPTVRRAQHFVRLFRYLVQDLYEASGAARSVLKEAVEALGSIIASKSNKGKGTESASSSSKEGAGNTDMADLNKLFVNPSWPCDVQAMRSDYLFIFASYVRCGGAHRDTGLQKALEIARIILKEPSVSPESIDSVRLFLEQIGESFSKRQDVKYAVTLLKEFAVIIRVHGIVLDLSGLFKNLTILCSAPTFANDKKFSSVVVTQVCSAALETCDMAAQENILSSLKFVPSLVTLLAHSVCLLGSDVIAEIEKRDPSPAFLCGVVVPLIFQLRTTAELATQTQWTDSWRQDAHAHAWLRLLSFALTVFQNQQHANLRHRGSLRHSPSVNSDTADPSLEIDLDASRGSLRKAKRRPSGRSSIAMSVRLAMAFVTLKAVILRGEEDISTVFPEAWLRTGAALRHMLRDGNAMFALRDRVPSAPPSPAVSPMSSTTFAELIDRSSNKEHKRSSSSTSDVFLSAPSQISRASSPTRLPSRRNSAQRFPCPRLSDYLAWSLLEFLCFRRSPLTIHLRTYMYERVVPLNELLQVDESTAGIPSFVGPGRRRSMRPISSMYTKPRLRPGSAATTPEASPRLGPSDPNISMVGGSANTYSMSGLAGTDYNTSPSKGSKGRPPVAHLGISTPPAHAFLSPSFVPASTSAESHLSQSQSVEDMKQLDMALDARKALTSTCLHSPRLVRRTYDRIRAVQRCLGYSTYLPVPESLAKEERAPSKIGAFDVSGAGVGNIATNGTPRSSVVLELEKEPEVHAWTKRKAGLEVMLEAEDLLRAWQLEAGITTTASDAGHGDVTMLVAEGNIDVGSTPTKETFSHSN